MAANTLTASEAAARIAGGTLTAEGLVGDCLDRIEARDGEVGAWARIDRELALREARARDREPRRGLLHGIPVGVKDVIDTVDFATEYGSPIYRGHRAAWDAAVVALIREAGGIVLGKTVTTEFATRYRAGTRNPRNLAHTPGGSSSGSAAAVADCMVPLALGTQTKGSVIRPAAYCGVVGYKPSFGTIAVMGVKIISDSQDTLGVFARGIADAGLIVAAVSGRPLPRLDGAELRAPRIGFCRSPVWRHADAPTAAAFESAIPRLAAAGARVGEVALPPPAEDLLEAQTTIVAFESWHALAYERTRHHDLLSATLATNLAAGGQVERAAYERACAIMAACRASVGQCFADWDVLLTPSAPGEAPLGLDDTGDPVFNSLWTALGLPCVSVPVFTGPTGLPIGAQIVGPLQGDARTLEGAEWVMRALS